jgi:hypothetical protein
MPRAEEGATHLAEHWEGAMRVSQIVSTAAICAALAAGLAACGKKETPTVRAEVAIQPAAKPSLWRIEAVNDGRVVRTLDLCADQAIQAGFRRPSPELNGHPCDRAKNVVETDQSYAARCRLDHNNYVVRTTQSGDAARDFTVQMSVTRQDLAGPTFEQTRHYTRIGDCPAGWRIGDAAAPGDKKVASTLAP